MKEIQVFPNIYSMPDENHENLHIEIELPGVDRENITFSMHDDSFFVRAVKPGTRYVGSAAICCPVEYTKAKARYHNGLLSIDVPYRQPREQGMEIPIE